MVISKSDISPSASDKNNFSTEGSDDYEYIKLIINGDKDKFRILVERYQNLIFRICIGFVRNKDDADDLTQDIFIRIFQNLHKFKGDSSFSTWVYRIAVNSSLNKVRKPIKTLIMQSIDNLTASGVGSSQAASSNANPEDLFINRENSELVARALEWLPDNQRTAIILSKYDDLTQKEIAGIMELTEGAVESLLYRAKRNLHKKLSTSFKNL